MPEFISTFILIKPDGVQRGLVGKIISRFEDKGYKLVAMKMCQADSAILDQHYEAHTSKGFYKGLSAYMRSAPVVAMVWTGVLAVEAGRVLIGATNPLSSAPGTIRGDFGQEVGRNLIHGSDSIESAEREIKLWFGDKELMDYDSCQSKWLFE